MPSSFSFLCQTWLPVGAPRPSWAPPPPLPPFCLPCPLQLLLLSSLPLEETPRTMKAWNTCSRYELVVARFRHVFFKACDDKTPSCWALTISPFHIDSYSVIALTERTNRKGKKNLNTFWKKAAFTDTLDFDHLTLVLLLKRRGGVFASHISYVRLKAFVPAQSLDGSETSLLKKTKL